eukprot:Nk52_evm1s2225 gene=Nk52_evmTU1s2225
MVAVVSNSVKNGQIEKAVVSLVKHSESRKDANGKKAKDLSMLMDEGETFLVMVGFKSTPQLKKKPIEVRLPVPLHTPKTSNICLITKDPQSQYKDLCEKNGVTLDEIMDVTHLRNNFKTYELKRQLCKGYDLFLADERVLPLLPRLLGKTFFEKKRLPLAVDMTAKDLRKELSRAISSTSYQLGNGPCTAVKVAHTGMSKKDIVRNVTEVVNHFQKHYPLKVQSINVKLPNTIALPVYNSLPTVAMEEESVLEEEKKEEEKEEVVVKKSTKKEEEEVKPKKKTAPAATEAAKKTTTVTKTNKKETSKTAAAPSPAIEAKKQKKNVKTVAEKKEEEAVVSPPAKKQRITRASAAAALKKEQEGEQKKEKKVDAKTVKAGSAKKGKKAANADKKRKL